MNQTPTDGWTISEQDQLLAEAIERDESRLRSFIRRHVTDTGDAEDILQDVFYELLQAYRMMKPIEHVTGWLFRVARNRIVDRFRSKRADSLSEPAGAEAEGSRLLLEDLLPSVDDGPEAAYARAVLFEALEDALDDLPREQREVFIAHELAGTSFRQLADETGLSINTLLSRKRYAVLHLRRRLQAIYNDFANR
ncbi:RNA polymerase sigma factor [Edaphobacter aggregans]|uniref:RNA polymerase sigma factor n=1 Tax=Edaphobacter aggregans TaxID=570835 RepID=UPI000555BD98|nr:sigma-70 family RNA polymerase sigma factor [Edaphobacter aggregans]